MRASEAGLQAPRGAVELSAPSLLGLLGLVLLALLAAGLVIGPVYLAPDVVAGALLDRASPEGIIVGEIRLPRVLLAACVGATLGLAGAALQGLLRNPLAEPGIIGTSGFAALGAVVTLYFGLANVWPWSQPLGGVLGALVGLALLLAVAGRMASVLTLILSGVALSSLAGACVALALNLAPNPFAALEIAFWLLGSFEDRSNVHLGLALAPMVLSWLVLLGCGRVLDALTLGEEVAQSLGLPLDRARLQLVAGVGLGVGAAVAVSGVIGFVGLVTPHLLRPFVGHRPAALLLPSALGGACLLVAADNLVRVLPTTSEVKVGVVTALIGVPFFIMLVIRARRHLV
ncbi:MAG: iron ABC transporter permease [Gammaproteobacteria bacterium]|nr:iron ABC transporter permease [Gammaproteobacteria bacterium]